MDDWDDWDGWMIWMGGWFGMDGLLSGEILLVCFC